MPEFTPLPETDLIDGQIVDTGYDPQQWAEHERVSRTYEREAMESINRPQPAQDWKGYYEDEFKEQEPQFLEAAWRAIAPNVAKVLPNVGKAIAAGVPGAPADLAVTAWHTMKWVAANRGMVNVNDYGFIKDMPDFKTIPGTSDYIADKYFDADTDSMEFAFGSLLTPDPAGIAAVGGKLAGVFGGPIAMARQVKASQTADPQRAQYLIKNFAEARDMGKAGEQTQDIYKQTGWFQVGEDWRFMMDLDQINFKQDALIEHFQAVIKKGDAGGPVSVPLGDIWEHPEFFQSYPELKDFRVTFHVNRALDEGVKGARFEAGGGEFVISGGRSGAAFIPGKKPEDAIIEIFGTSREDAWGRTQEAIAHEVEHFVQSIEGFSRGGSPQEFRQMSQVEGLRAANVQQSMLNMVDNGDLDPDDLQAIGEALFFEHGTWLNGKPEDQWDDVARQVSRFLNRTVNDEEERLLWSMGVGNATSDFTQIIKWFRGTDEVADMEKIINEIDLDLIDQMANDIYFSLEGEGMSRLAEAVWANRKSLPENFNPGEGFMNQLKKGLETSEGTMELVPGGQIRIPNE